MGGLLVSKNQKLDDGAVAGSKIDLPFFYVMHRLLNMAVHSWPSDCGVLIPFVVVAVVVVCIFVL